jgi:hypothetical protein
MDETVITDNTSPEVETDSGVVQAEDTNTETETPEQEYSLDDLLKMSREDYDEFDDEAQHKGMQPLSHWMKHVPADVRKHLANIRADYTRKTQSLSEERNALQAELTKEREQLAMERRSLYSGDMAKRTAELASDETKFDLFDEEGMQKEIQRQAAKMLNQMLKPAQEQLQVEHRKMELHRFADEHPEIKSDDYRMPIAKMLQDRPELRLEDAYFIVKAKVDSEKATSERAELEAQRSRRKQAFSKTSSGTASKPAGTPKFKNAWEAFQYHRDNGK